MSICICECGNYIDSDAEPECFVEENGEIIALCRDCRERLPEDHPYWAE